MTRRGEYTLQALYQPQGGIVNSEEGIRAHAQAAQKHGAVLRTGEKVQRWLVLPSGQVEVTTDKGTYTAGRLVLTAGAWMPEMVPELRVSPQLLPAHLVGPFQHSNLQEATPTEKPDRVISCRMMCLQLPSSS